MEKCFSTQIITSISKKTLSSSMHPISSPFQPNTYLQKACNISDSTGWAPPLYSSRTRGKWFEKPYVVRLAPDGWRQKHLDSPDSPETQQEYNPDCSVCSSESRAAWARLIAKVYEVNPLECVKCGSPMKILAVITDPDEVKKILRHLVKIDRPPPDLDPSTLN